MAMQFQFDANQEYQISAIEAVVNLLEGQPHIDVEAMLQFAASAGFAAIANQLDLDEVALFQNVQAVQAANNLPRAERLECLCAGVETVEGVKTVRFANFSLEMETGTGKTYIYLRTALELFRRYGLRKFIVVVPSLAVREGVLKTLQVTVPHFRALYDSIPYRYYAYDSSNLSQVRQFALSDSIEIMVMTLDSFNKASNVIRQSTDRLQGEAPLHLVQAARPILILDEPQNMESALSVQALASLDPLFALRYSATHRNPYNLVYRLTPYEAYRQGLVKRVEVAGVERQGDENQPYLRLEGVRSEKSTVTARLAVHRLLKDGAITEQVVTVRPGDALEAKTNRAAYAPWVVEEIDAGEEWVRFTNGVTLQRGEALGAGTDKEAVFREQIRYTLEEHARKQARLKDARVKVLSLFFIDRVDSYAREDGLIRRLFVEELEELKKRHPKWEEVDAAKVQAAYFAKRQTRSGEVVYEDSKTGESERDREAYDLIMRDKERLLSFAEPACFIFSHSALREGWDSPNVFQICTLNHAVSEVRKRQEIGRGLRLAVNQAGERVRDDRVNVLTVIANESYQRYVERYQAELEEAFGGAELPPRPSNARMRRPARLRKEYMLMPEFKELWERIKHKTRYAVKIDSKKLIEDVVTELNSVEIQPPRVVVARARLDVAETGDSFAARHVAERQTPYIDRNQSLPDLTALMAELMERTTPPIRLTRRTLLEIFRRTTRRQEALANPHEFATAAVQIIKRKLADQLVAGIQYTKIDEWYEMSQFEGEIQSWEEYLVPAARAVYDHVICDSDVERRFVEGLERRDDVKLYLKLPSWFTVPTPVGEYNPDWAIVMEKRDEHGEPLGKSLLYLVRETKSTTSLDDLLPDERRKIQCGKRHFEDALGVCYRVVTTADELP